MSTFVPHEFLFADRQIERRLVNHFVSQGRPDLCSLRIRAQGGRVRFRGYLDSETDREYVLLGARRVAGVIEVEDQIEVRRPVATAATISHAPTIGHAPTTALAQPLAAARWIA